jgi:hypothetical protein
MKLEIFKTKHNKMINKILISLVIVFALFSSLTIIRSYSIFKEEKTFNVLKGKVPDFSSNYGGNITIAVLVDGEKQTSFPKKNDGYYYEVSDISCTNGASATWNSSLWNITISNLEDADTTCTISFKKKHRYTDEILNGADPAISGDLIPVVISDDGTVNKTSVSEKWYDYTNKVWANAVILVDKTITYEDGDVIPEDNIESYFVWIPKYSYKLWSLGEYSSASGSSSESNAQEIEIIFGTTDTTDKSGECTTPMTSGESGSCTIGDYMTHPAFINAGTNGLWVAKFKSSGSTSALTFKPNKSFFKGSSGLYTYFMLFYNYERDLDSHMMKNTEWGAVAYLSHSKYGINAEVYISAGSCGVVGSSTSSTSGSSKYNTANGFNGSTTGNISGVYDMSGGSWEYVAAYIDGKAGSSGFSNENLSLYADYLDIYNSSSTQTSYNYRILGDATGEMGPFYSGPINSWYSDKSEFVTSSNPWFQRSGPYGVGSGQFEFQAYNGNIASDTSIGRAVLSIH